MNNNNHQQIKIMNTTEIEFTILSLDGDTFQVSIERAAAEKYWHQPYNPYSKYGLDTLKEAISKITGNDPITQQLVVTKILTISTPIIPLANQVITLIIIPPFSVAFTLGMSANYFYPINANIDWLTETQNSSTAPTICYLHSTTLLSPIEVIGMDRSHFKIKSDNIPFQYLNTPDCDRYYWKLPEYVWLKYDKHRMIIPPSTYHYVATSS